MPPNVTVVMPVYNGECFLREAIDSLLNQTHADFELLIIDDGSVDASADIARSYADRRLRLVSNGVNQGLVPSLNRGLQLAQGRYLARLDADDISLPERLGRQVQFLEQHPEVGVVGTAFQFIGHANQRLSVIRHPTEHGAILWDLFFQNPLGHPTVVMRTAIIKRVAGYRLDMREAEDYELWTRLRSHTRFANLPDVLVLYRQHPASKTSLGNADVQITSARIARALIVETLGRDIPLDHVRRLQDYRFRSLSEISVTAKLILDLWRAFEGMPSLTPSERQFVRVNVVRRWLGLARRALFKVMSWPR